MILAALTFALTLGLVVGSYWLLVLRPEAQTIGRLKARLEVKIDRAAGPSIIRGGPVRLDRSLLRRWHRDYAIASAERLIARAGLRLDPARLVAWTFTALPTVVAIVKALQANWFVALLAGLLTPFAPYLYLRNAARKRLQAFEELFPEALDLIARSLRGGHTLTTSLAVVSEELPDPVKSEFRALYEQHNYGLPLAQVLRALASRVPLMDVRFFVTAVITQRETGGNLAEVLDNLAAVTRDRFRVRQHLRVLTAQGRITGWILGLFPAVLAVLLTLFNPAHMNAFFSDPVGIQLLELAVVMQAIGALVIRRIVRVEF
jgi:tight adherence protein B